MQEETEKTSVVFGESAKAVHDWSATLAESFGVSKGAALEAAGVFGNMFHSLHIGESDAATMSKRLVELAADMASFNNALPEDTLKALQSGLAGQVRPLRQFGVFLSQDRIKAEALADGIAKSDKHLSASQKLLAAYNIILKDTKLQVGDVARNSASLSVAQSKLRAELENAEATIGDALRPALVELANSAAQYLEKLQSTGQLQKDVNGAMRTAREIFSGVKAVVVPLADAIKGLSDALGGVKNTAKIVATVFVASKIFKWAAAFRALSTALFATAAGETAVGVASAGLFTKLGRLARLAAVIRGGALGAAAGLTGGVVAGAAAVGTVVVTAGGATEQHGDRTAKYPRTAALIQKAASGAKLTPTEELALAALGQFSFASAPDSRLRKAEDILRGKKLTGTAAGANVSDRQPGRSPAGPAGRQVGAGGGARGTSRPRASLRFQLSIIDERLAKAEQTATQRDDRAILARKAVLLKELIGKTKSLKDRTVLQQELAGVEGQIRAIDKTASDKRVAHQKALVTSAEKQLTKLRGIQNRLESRIKAIQGRFNDAVDTAREGIGELFAGPILQPTDLQRRQTLGLKGKGQTSDVPTLTADLKAQTRQFAAFQRDLATLKKRGAPAELIKELRAQGIAAAPEAHALATAGKGTLTAFLKAFGKREALAVKTAKTVMHSQLVKLNAARVDLTAIKAKERPLIVVVQLDGKEIARNTTKRQNRGAKNTVTQRTGRYAGTAFLVSS